MLLSGVDRKVNKGAAVKDHYGHCAKGSVVEVKTFTWAVQAKH